MARSMQHYTQHTTCNRHRAMHSCNAPCCTVRATDHVKRRVECCMFCARAACSGAHVACAGRATLYHSGAARASTDVRDVVQQRDVDDLLLVDQVAHIILRILAHLPATGREQPAVDVTTLTAAAAKGAPRPIDRSRSIPTRPKRADALRQCAPAHCRRISAAPRA